MMNLQQAANWLPGSRLVGNALTTLDGLTWVPPPPGQGPSQNAQTFRTGFRKEPIGGAGPRAYVFEMKA